MFCHNPTNFKRVFLSCLSQFPDKRQHWCWADINPLWLFCLHPVNYPEIWLAMFHLGGSYYLPALTDVFPRGVFSCLCLSFSILVSPSDPSLGPKPYLPLFCPAPGFGPLYSTNSFKPRSKVTWYAQESPSPWGQPGLGGRQYLALQHIAKTNLNWHPSYLGLRWLSLVGNSGDLQQASLAIGS